MSRTDVGSGADASAGAGTAVATDGPDPVRQMARGGLVNAVGAAVGSFSNIGIVLVITNAFAPAEAGAFFTLTSLILITAVVARLGTPTGLVYFISGGRARGRTGRERSVLRLAARPVVLLSVVVAVALGVAAPQVLDALNIGDGSGDATTQLRVLAVFVPFAVLSEVVLSATRGMGRMRPTVLIDRTGRSVLQFVLVLGTAGWGQPVALAVAWSLPYLPAAVLAWRRFRRDTATSAATGAAGGPPPSGRTFWRFTAPRSVTSVVQIALQRLDIIIVAAYLGPAEAAVYTAASRFLVLGQLGGQAVSLAAQPRLAAAMAQGRTDEANALYRTATCWLVLLSWPLYLVCLHLADQMLALFGPEYGSGRSVVLVLGAVMLVATGCGMVDVVLNMAGRTSWNLANNLVALVVNVVVDVILVPRIGIVGAAVGWAAAIAVNNVLPLAQLALFLRIHPFARGTALAMVSSLVCLGAVPAAGHAISGDVRGTLVGIAVGSVLLLAFSYVMRATLALDVLLAAGRRRPAGGAA